MAMPFLCVDVFYIFGEIGKSVWLYFTKLSNLNKM